MKLAIFDIDDTIVGETKFMLENAPEFLKSKYNIIVDEINYNEYDIRKVYNLEKHLIRQGLSKVQAIEKAEEIKKTFWTKNFVSYCMLSIDDKVEGVINLLKKYDYKIHFVSLRGDTGKDELLFKLALALTKLQLKRGNIQYDCIKLVDTMEAKIDYINSMNPEFLFEDQPNVVNNVSSNSYIYCMSREHNKDAILNSNILRVDNFDSIELESILEKKRIEEGKKRKSNIFVKGGKLKDINIAEYSNLKRILTEANYSIVTAVGTPIFNSIYNPIVKGKNNIPSKESVAFVGTHRDKLDPVLVATTSSRSIHWGALLRMFQGKESLFSSTKNKFACDLSALFLSSVGVVPIARKTDENYMQVNLNSINILYQILNSEGAVGLFPEGTINREPQIQNVLPLKSNRIFRLVKDVEGMIQPFSVVWLPKDLEIKNKVIINYGLPINTRNRSINEIRDLWLDAVNKGTNEANELVDYIINVYNNEDYVFDRDDKIKVAVNKYKKQ